MKHILTFLAPLLLATLSAVYAGEPPFPAGIKHVRVERSDSDRYQFLHDPAIEFHKGELFAAWYNCPEQEIVGESLIRCRRSKDGGKTWSALEVIAEDTSRDGTYYVPAQLLSHGGVLHAFVGKMKGHDLITTCAVFVLDEATNRWQPRGDIADLFLPNCQPLRMADGNWIMAGRVASRFGVKPYIPAVAISRGDDLTGRWQVVPLSKELSTAQLPETTVWVEGPELLAINEQQHLKMVMRTSVGRKEGNLLDGGALNPPRAWSTNSTDGGKTWSIAQEEPDLWNTVSEGWFGQSRTGTQLYVYNDGPAFSRMALRYKVKLANGAWSDEYTFFDAGIHNSYPTLIETTAGEFRAVWDSGDENRHRRSIRFGKLTHKK